jgi:hypothetical protein
MMNRDYLPTNDRGLLEWVVAFLLNLFPSLGRFVFPDHVYQDLSAKRDDYAQKLEIAENPMTRTKGTVQDKNDARNVLKKAVRQAVRQYLAFNPAVTDKDRDDLGLPIYKTTRTPSPVATTYPDSDVDSSMIRRLTIHFYDQGHQHSKAKPAGQHGAEIKWAILDTPPESLSDLINSSFDTHTPFTLEFDQNQRGKTVYFCLCWENTRGEKGPWSEIQHAIVP